MCVYTPHLYAPISVLTYIYACLQIYQNISIHTSASFIGTWFSLMFSFTCMCMYVHVHVCMHVQNYRLLVSCFFLFFFFVTIVTMFTCLLHQECLHIVKLSCFLFVIVSIVYSFFPTGLYTCVWHNACLVFCSISITTFVFQKIEYAPPYIYVRLQFCIHISTHMYIFPPWHE
jgi:hypothetical protein